MGRIVATKDSELLRRTRFLIFPPDALSSLGSFFVVRLSTEADKRGRPISLVTLARVASLRRLLSFLPIIVVTLGSRFKEIRSKQHTCSINSGTQETGSKYKSAKLTEGLHGYGNNATEEKRRQKALSQLI